MVASMMRDAYYIGFHAALEFYGVAYSYRNTVYVSVNPRDRFDVFQYQNTVYRPYLTKDTKTGVTNQQYKNRVVKICSKERLFLECLRYPAKAGGWEEVLKSLQGLGGVDFDVLLDYLLKENNQSLLRRTGFILELLKETSVFYRHLDEKTLTRIESHVNGTVRYLMSGRKGDLNERWLLYVSHDFTQHLRGI
jgi:predicted transcriptional regulator of viral defense system